MSVLWRPSQTYQETSELWGFLHHCIANGYIEKESYEEMRRWSVYQGPDFWSTLAAYFGMDDLSAAETPWEAGSNFRGYWFPGTKTNYVNHLFSTRSRPESTAITSVSQTRATANVSYAELRTLVATVASALHDMGVRKGDRVVAYVPNILESVVAFLASASIGAIWSSCSPDFGTATVVGRWRTLKPKVLFCVDGYMYGKRRISRRNEVKGVVSGLPTLSHVIVVPYLEDEHIPQESFAVGKPLIDWRSLLKSDATVDPIPVDFDHPLWIVFSSGTTGTPKAIVHGHGGIVLEHVKALGLHHNIDNSDRYFRYASTSWMMWNYLVSGMLLGAEIVLFDGDPAYPVPDLLWRLASDLDVTNFGIPTALLERHRHHGIVPSEIDGGLPSIEYIGVTGSPLSAKGFDWVYESVKRDVLLGPASGGTDLCTAFVGPSPLHPVLRGAMSCRFLGAGVDALDDTGNIIDSGEGELALIRPMPSMPVYLWGDDGTRYRETYFRHHPDVWTHGDRISIAPNGSCRILGRSDATLNRGGIRLGPSEVYSAVLSVDGVEDALVVHLPDDSDELVLFVETSDGEELSDESVHTIRRAVAESLSPKFVPDRIHHVSSIPKSPTGKRLEVPVKRVLLGEEPATVLSANTPGSERIVDEFARLARSFIRGK